MTAPEPAHVGGALPAPAPFPLASATEILAALKAGTVSSREVTEMCIARIERYDGTVNAVVIRDFDRALEQADRADRARADGSEQPLLGLPMTVKDCLHVRGLVTTAGVEKYANARAAEDSRTVAAVRAAGAVILGKTNVPPYAADVQTWNPLFGRTTNPWDPGRTPGGSSGGSAAALAAGFSALELGSDFAGSIRQPAAFCGVYGLKPSETALPRTGHVPGSMLPNVAICMEVQGPMARSAADLALALDVVAGPDVGEDAAWRLVLPPARHERLSDFRVAFLPSPPWLPMDGEILAAADRLRADLVRLGATVAVAQPELFGDLRGHHLTYVRMFHALTARGTAEERRARAERLRAVGSEADHAAADGVTATVYDYITWCEEREYFRESFRRFFADWDVLIAPNHCVTAFPHDARPIGERGVTVGDRVYESAMELVHPALGNLSGQPALAFPVGFTAGGLPIGLQAVGPYLEDRTPVRFADLLAQELGGFVAPPGCP